MNPARIIDKIDPILKNNGCSFGIISKTHSWQNPVSRIFCQWYADDKAMEENNVRKFIALKANGIYLSFGLVSNIFWLSFSWCSSFTLLSSHPRNKPPSSWSKSWSLGFFKMSGSGVLIHFRSWELGDRRLKGILVSLKKVWRYLRKDLQVVLEVLFWSLIIFTFFFLPQYVLFSFMIKYFNF